MKITHRYNSEERQHFVISKQYSFKLKPKLLYSGILSQQKGWKDNKHVHNFAEILFVMKWRGQILLNKETYNIEQGDIVIYNAGQEHTEQSSDSAPLKLLFLGLDKVEITGLPPNHLIPPDYSNIYHSGDLEEVFRTYFSLIVDEMAGKDTFYAEIAKNTAITLLMYIYRLINKFDDVSTVFEEPCVLDDVIKYLDEHYLEPINLAQISSACHISKYYLSHMFSDIKKQTVMQYIIDKRLEYSKNLLETTKKPVEEIAFVSGFGNSSNFSRVFKEKYGKTPLLYRKSNGQA